MAEALIIKVMCAKRYRTFNSPVDDSQVTGYVWAENIGWINLSPSTHGGIVNDGTGNLSGFAWGENVGWINFDPNVPGNDTDYGVTIGEEGSFDGWAWGENIGWIHFQSASPVSYKVQVCIVRLDDFAHFAEQWLQSGMIGANFDEIGDVDLTDLGIFVDYWLEYCPDGWPLK